MNTQLPGFIALEKPLYANALVAAQRAQDTRTGTPALVLAAPPATAPCLARGRQALETLRGLDPPPPGLPTVIAWGEDETGSATLILGELRGEPLRDRLLQLQPLPEAALLAVARQHAQTLAALHAAGYSGLRPTSAEVLWSEDPPWFTLLGWEWLMQGAEDAPGDVRAAAGLWIELATGAPPGPELQIECGPQPPGPTGGAGAGWLALSLGTRLLLHETWRSPTSPPADRLARDLAEAQRQRERPAAELLARGRELLPTDPAAALAWLDLARRASPPPQGADQAFMAAQAALTGQVATLIAQGRRDLELGQYRAAERTFSRAAGAWQAAPTDRLAASRWRAAAQGLLQAVEADTSSRGLPARELERSLLRVVELANDDQPDLARQTLEELLGRLPAGINLPALAALQADLRAGQLQRQAQAAEGAGNLSRAVELYAGAVAEQPHVPYWSEWTAATGDPEAVWQTLQGTLRRAAEAEDLAAQARRALDGGNPTAAVPLARRAADLARDRPAQLAEYTALAQRAALRAAAVEAGVPGDPATLAAGERTRALAALLTLQRAFPDDSWAQEQGARWRTALLTELTGQPAGPVGQLLYQGWPKDEAVQAAWRTAAPQALAGWERELREATTQMADGRPAALAQATERLAACREALAAGQGWLIAAGTAEAAGKLLEQARTLAVQAAARQSQQAALRVQFEEALGKGLPAAGILAQAAEARVELYDDPARSVQHLQALAGAQAAASPVVVWGQTLKLAELAWRAGDVEHARQGFQAVTDDPQAPDSARQQADLALGLLATGSKPPEPGAVTEVQWQARADELLARFEGLQKTAAGQARPAGDWLWRVAPALLLLVLLVWSAIELASLRGIPAPVTEATLSPTARASSTMTFVTGATTLTPAPIAAERALVGSISFEPTTLTLPADGHTTQEIVLRVLDVYGQPVAGQRVSLSQQQPDWQAARHWEAVSGPTGEIRWTFAAGSEPGDALLRASVDKVVSRLAVTLIAPTTRIVIEPASFDIGMSDTADLLVRASQVKDGAPMTGTVVTLRVAPPQLAEISGATLITTKTDANGEVKGWQLTAGQVGQGYVSAQLGTGQGVTATLTVRPVVVAQDLNTSLYSSPSTNANVVAMTKTDERYLVVGKNSEDTWLQVRLADGQLAWVVRIAAVKVEGETAEVPIVIPGAEPIEVPPMRPSPTHASTTAVVSTPTPGTR